MDEKSWRSLRCDGFHPLSHDTSRLRAPLTPLPRPNDPISPPTPLDYTTTPDGRRVTYCMHNSSKTFFQTTRSLLQISSVCSLHYSQLLPRVVFINDLAASVRISQSTMEGWNSFIPAECHPADIVNNEVKCVASKRKWIQSDNNHWGSNQGRE